MLNPPLLLVSALFFLALASLLYLGSWGMASALTRLGRGGHARAKRIWLTALVLALLPTVSGATLHHIHDIPMLLTGANHHSTLCRDMSARLLHWTGLVGAPGTRDAAGALLTVLAWLMVLAGTVLLARLAVATIRLERGIVPFLAPPSPRLAASLRRVGALLPGLPAHRFFECPIPPTYSSVLGFWRARCVLSQEFVRTATDEELDAVVAHEASHLCGRDVFSTFLVGVLNCFFFFLRPVRLLGRHWRAAAELACDDAAVAATRKPLAMASALLRASGVPVGAATSTVLPSVALPFADEAACSTAVRVERLIAQAQEVTRGPVVESRFQVVAGWIVIGILAAMGAAVLLSAEAACFAHCLLEAVAHFL